MNPTRWRITALLVLAIVAQLLSGCGSTNTQTELETPPSPGLEVFATPGPLVNSDFNSAQATLAVEQHQAAENSQNNSPVVVPEKIQDRQTDAASDYAAGAPTLTANQVRQTVVAEAHAIVAAEITQTAQAVAATNAYPLAATSAAATQTALLVQQYQHEQDNFVNRIVAPLIPITAAILFILLVVLVIALLRRQFLPGQWFNSTRNTAEVNNYSSNLVTIDGEVSPYYNHPPHPVNPPNLSPENNPALPCEKLVYVEVVNANEPPVVHWVDDVERQLGGDRGAGI
jgi:hypothetical protein